MRPIETRYKGYRFRSRLEARWAVAFDAFGIPWQYEPQGYELETGPYLPDFYLPRAGGPGCWVEIKPEGFEVSTRLTLTLWELAWSTQQDAVLLSGIGPGFRRWYGWSYHLQWGTQYPGWFVPEAAVMAGRAARFEHGERG